jgi:hypothetical protein
LQLVLAQVTWLAGLLTQAYPDHSSRIIAVNVADCSVVPASQLQASSMA